MKYWYVTEGPDKVNRKKVTDGTSSESKTFLGAGSSGSEDQQIKVEMSISSPTNAGSDGKKRKLALMRQQIETSQTLKQHRSKYNSLSLSIANCCPKMTLQSMKLSEANDDLVKVNTDLKEMMPPKQAKTRRRGKLARMAKARRMMMKGNHN